MKIKIFSGLLATTGLLVSGQPAWALTADEARDIAVDAYVYGYSLMSVEMSRKVITNVKAPTTTRAPMGQFANLREYPSAAYRDVTAPNADTLYSNAFIDVSKEPWVVSWPAMGDRYYVWEFYDAWVPVTFDPGSRTTGQGAQTYAITGPNWKGSLPEGVKEVKSPTSTVWILARTYSTGTPEDYKAVWALQDQYKLYPLSAWGKKYTPPPGKVDPSIDMKRSVRDSVNALGAVEYFGWMAKLMVNNPPSTEDAPMMAKLAKIGLVPGQDFDLGKLEPAVADAIRSAPKVAWKKIVDYTKDSGQTKDGWLLNLKVGHYGTDYMARAWLSAFGIPANAPKDAVYVVGMADSAGQPLDASKNNYVIHFDKASNLPPASGFWSLTMYDSGYFFIPNPLNRYTVSMRNKLKTNADGSIDLYLQKDNPGPDKESNWLPAPASTFIPMFRLYWPKESPPSVLDGTWWPPKITKAS
ncbi:DUF1254 domain-containing protein [Variovorax ginsengisoli]|uniref:DUF1254 domain-containing protein n=1 Tax=Variovorax ginsengisoli TaxID=363844 RepID=A0ABT8S169_9BURK|nr:DUF1254 domain-containing protein [Variovorax ginsengisoli]MDN8613383.1 DUF1254 domain-containing protein [Variovorax ginsengisoli]MDO1532553.1 DUF1254 domain-containing protein [Variovorax ginsengisoli]